MPPSEQIPELISIAGRSLYVSGIAVALSSLVGIPLGGWLGLSRGRAVAFARLITHTGMALPPVVAGLVLYILLSHSGPLGFLGWLLTPQAMILAQFLLSLPFVVGITMASVAGVPADLLLQLKSLGATPRQARWAVLREAKAGVVLAIAAAFGRCISEVGAVMIVGGNIRGQTRVLTTAIVLETGQGEFAFALALGAILLSLSLVVNCLFLRLQPLGPGA
jgi:tungstate transport system permease protein